MATTASTSILAVIERRQVLGLAGAASSELNVSKETTFECGRSILRLPRAAAVLRVIHNKTQSPEAWYKPAAESPIMSRSRLVLEAQSGGVVADGDDGAELGLVTARAFRGRGSQPLRRLVGRGPWATTPLPPEIRFRRIPDSARPLKLLLEVPRRLHVIALARNEVAAILLEIGEALRHLEGH